MAVASNAFSYRLLRHAEKLILKKFSPEERHGFIQTFRYSAYLMGIPKELETTSYEQGEDFFKLVNEIEPPQSMESVIAANNLVHAGPALARVKGKEEKILLRKVYSISRYLIGNETADELQFPQYRIWTDKGCLLCFSALV